MAELLDRECQECIQRCAPSDPRQPVFVPFDKRHRYVGLTSNGYLKSCCHYCPNYTEKTPQRVEVKHIIYEHHHSDITKKQWDTIQQLELKVNSLLKKRNEVTSKKRFNYKDYS